MTSTGPARTAARRTRSAVYGPRSGRVVLSAVLGLLLAYTAFAAARHPHNAEGGMLNGKGRPYLSSVRWPRRVQAALVIGDGRPAVSPHEQPVPIASLAKVMTAYLTLKHTR